MRLKLLPLTPRATYLHQAVAVYNEYVPGEIRFQRHFFRSHMERPGYVGLALGLERGDIVGVAFGSRSLPGQWWHECVAGRVGAQHRALQAAWVLTQLHILSAYRNRGLGGYLHDAILMRQPATRVLLSTQVSNRAAQRFYARRDWQVLHPGFMFVEGDEPFMVLCKTLPGDSSTNGAQRDQ